MNNINNIQLIATKDLIKELNSRFERLALIASRERLKDPNQDTVIYDFKGNNLEVLGLIEFLKSHVLDLYYDDIADSKDILND